MVRKEKKKPGKKKNQKKILKRYYFLLTIIACLLIIIIFIIPEKGKPVKKVKETIEKIETEPSGQIEKPLAKWSLYFIIDDVGNNLYQLEPFLKFPGALTIAVMPQRLYSEEAAKKAYNAGKEIIVHQPMEPVGEQNPGAGAIYSCMDKEKIYQIMVKNIKTVPYAKGINNHMGSLATSNKKVMTAVLNTAKKNNMYFLDSCTTKKTVGKGIAEKLNLNYTMRNSMFLDNKKDRDSILYAIQQGLEVAKKQGHAVMIGHVMTEGLADILTEIYPELINEGYMFNKLSDLFLGEQNR